MKTNFKPRSQKDLCLFCGDFVNLKEEGVTYKTGACAHEQCDDNNEFEKENAADLRD